MNNSFYRRWTVFTIVILGLSASWIWFSKVPEDRIGISREQIPYVGFAAPDFSLGTIHGEIVSLSTLKGQPVIINLWASWCPPCRAEMPALQNVHEEYNEQGLVILAINATNQDNLEDARKFIQGHKITLPVLLDETGEISDLYRLQSLPTTYFVDGKGVIQEIVIGGPMAEALLRVRAERLIEGDLK